MYQFPATDFHELNLDWMLQQIKAITAEWGTEQTNLETWKTNTTTYINAYLAEHCSDEAVRARVSEELAEMVEDGTLLALLQDPVSDEVTAWLAERLSGSTYPIDSTFTQANAAPDSLLTGNWLRNLDNATGVIDLGITAGEASISVNGVTVTRNGNRYTFNGTDESSANVNISITGSLASRVSNSMATTFIQAHDIALPAQNRHIYRCIVKHISGTVTKPETSEYNLRIVGYFSTNIGFSSSVQTEGYSIFRDFYNYVGNGNTAFILSYPAGTVFDNYVCEVAVIDMDYMAIGPLADIANSIAPLDTVTVQNDHASGEIFMLGSSLVRARTDISAGTTVSWQGNSRHVDKISLVDLIASVNGTRTLNTLQTLSIAQDPGEEEAQEARVIHDPEEVQEITKPITVSSTDFQDIQTE